MKQEVAKNTGIALCIVVCIHTGLRDTMGCSVNINRKEQQMSWAAKKVHEGSFPQLACAIPKNKDTWLFQLCILSFYVIKKCKCEVNCCNSKEKYLIAFSFFSFFITNVCITLKRN